MSMIGKSDKFLFIDGTITALLLNSYCLFEFFQLIIFIFERENKRNSSFPLFFPFLVTFPNVAWVQGVRPHGLILGCIHICIYQLFFE